jgi:transcriptional regulator with XRE-family HTH domain
MAKERHWTEGSSNALAHRIAFDFIAQVESRLEARSISQVDLAKRLGVSAGAVSKLLNHPENLTLQSIAKYARALGMKAAIVAFDDGDVDNEQGPINSAVFNTCWERAGKPRDSWSLEVGEHNTAATTKTVVIPQQRSGNTRPLQEHWRSLSPHISNFRLKSGSRGNEGTMLNLSQPAYTTNGK